jgi:hypothetical protein
VVPEVIPAPKKRGRPKRIVADVPDMNPVEAKKRGRPKKVVSSTDETVPAVPKKRGRPAKVKNEPWIEEPYVSARNQVVDSNEAQVPEISEMDSVIGLIDMKIAELQEAKDAYLKERAVVMEIAKL